ncbi:MAG: GHKL domain-containing protein [Nitrospirae bacterium]|nr:GHKL domain-containing protein [Nitrospirota bacterium]
MKAKYAFAVDSALAIKTWPPNMEKLSHRPAAGIIGKKVDKIFPLLQGKIELVFNDGKKRRITDFRNTCLMGTDLSSDVYINPVKDKKGKVGEVHVEFDNVTGECPLGRRLSDSERMIAIGKVASSLAHGVRNPLNAIKGAVVYLRERYGHEATLLEFSTIINDEINKLDRFISNFLSAAKGETKFVQVNLEDVLRSIITMIKPRAEIQNIDIRQDLRVLPPVSGDPFQIEQALFNIINNAMEAMPKGGAINIKTSLKWEKDSDYASIEISDTGKGIPEKALSRLGELSRKPEKNDRGFGVFLSREIIKSHNGKLLWESIRGKGTTFKIFLPVNSMGPISPGGK